MNPETPAAALTRTSCYYCGGPESRTFATENGFELVKCAGCGLLYVSPRPHEGDIAEAVRQGLHPGNLETNSRFYPPHLWEYRRVLRDLYGAELTARKRAWLDVGCGHGEFLLSLTRLAGAQVAAVGSEPNEHKQRSARSRGLDVSFIPLEGHGRKYDCISLLNVYSHVPDPGAFLELLRERLVPGGELVLQTGDVAGMTPETLFRPLYLPDHLSFADESIVTGLLRRKGFRIVKVRKYPAFPPLATGMRIAMHLALGRISRVRVLARNYSVSRRQRTDMWIRAALD
jgi:SAM-dependent methyltransferase